MFKFALVQTPCLSFPSSFFCSSSSALSWDSSPSPPPAAFSPCSNPSLSTNSRFVSINWKKKSPNSRNLSQLSPHLFLLTYNLGLTLMPLLTHLRPPRPNLQRLTRPHQPSFPSLS